MNIYSVWFQTILQSSLRFSWSMFWLLYWQSFLGFMDMVHCFLEIQIFSELYNQSDDVLQPMAWHFIIRCAHSSMICAVTCGEVTTQRKIIIYLSAILYLWFYFFRRIIFRDFLICWKRFCYWLKWKRLVQIRLVELGFVFWVDSFKPGLL